MNCFLDLLFGDMIACLNKIIVSQKHQAPGIPGA